MRTFLFALLMLTALPAAAQVQETDGYMPAAYQNADRTDYDKSVIYIFFNNEPCYTCAAAVEMLENIYNRNFINEYNMFMINYQNDDENNFIQTYSLSQPLEVVLVRVDDGSPFGYRKIENLEDMTTDPVSLEEYFVNQVNEFFGSNE